MKARLDKQDRPWTVFYPGTMFGRVYSFERYDVAEPYMAELLNGRVFWNRDPKGRRLIRQCERELRKAMIAPVREEPIVLGGCVLTRFAGGFFLKQRTPSVKPFDGSLQFTELNKDFICKCAKVLFPGNAEPESVTVSK